MAEPINFNYATGGEYKDINIIESKEGTLNQPIFVTHYDHNLTTGAAIKFANSSTIYYIRKQGDKKFTVHASPANAATNQSDVWTGSNNVVGDEVYILVTSSSARQISSCENSFVETNSFHGYQTGNKIKFEISSLNKANTAAVKITNGGDNFSTAPTISISSPSGSLGTLATAIALLDPSGVIKKVILTNPGAGYVTAPTVSLSDLSFTVKEITVTNSGSGYITAPLVRITGGGGSGAEAVTVLDGMSGSWLVETINLINSGSGYSSTPTVSLVGGGVDQLSSIILTSGGSGYSSAPTVSFNGGGGSGATATASITETVQTGTDWEGNPTYGTVTRDYVTAVTLTSAGDSYSTSPTVVFSGGGGNGAVATVNLAGVNPNGTIATATATISSSTANLQGESKGTLGTLINELVDEIDPNLVYFVRKVSNLILTIHRTKQDALGNLNALDFGVDNVFSQVAAVKLINDDSQSTSSALPTVNQTPISHDVLQGSVTLPVENSNGFESGKNIIIDEGDCQEETNTILRATTSYLVLTGGLLYPHEKGKLVRLVLPNEQI